MSTIAIAAPFWLILPPLIWLTERYLTAQGLFKQQGLPGDWAKLIEPSLVPIVGKLVSQGHASIMKHTLFIALTCLALALADVSLGESEQPKSRNLTGRVIIADLSVDGAGGSHAQKFTIASLLETDSARDKPIPTAFIATSLDSFEIVPLTTDYRQIERYLNVLDPSLMPVQGRSLAQSFERGQAVLRRADIRFGQVILVTGGNAPALAKHSTAKFNSGQIGRVIMHDGSTISDAWMAFALKHDAVLLHANDTAAALDLLDETVTKGLKDQIIDDDTLNDGRFRLQPFFTALAGLCWLGLFRREGRR